MPNTYDYFRYSDPDQNPAFRGWHRQPILRDACALDRAADLELSHGRFAAADRLAWLAAGLREGAAP